MALTAREKGDLSRRVGAIDVPRTISLAFIQYVFIWVNSSGREWTVERLKSIKTDFLRKKAGLDPVSKWITKNPKKKSIFKGIIGSLERFAFKSDTNFERCIALLNVYTAFLAPQVTEKQARKFFDGVTSKPVTITPDLIDVIKSGIQLSGLRTFYGLLPQPKPLLSYMASPSKRAPLPTGTVPEVEGIVDSLRFLATKGGNVLYTKFASLFNPVLQGLEPERDVVLQRFHSFGMFSTRLEEDYTDLYVGQIGLIQEPGYKLRAVANPGRIFQRVLEPLGSRLFSLLKELPWDCTHEQRKADSAIQQALTLGRKVFSVDLSGATDHFPLDLQMIVLKQLLPKATDVDLFMRISKARWRLPKGIPQSILREFNLTNFVSWTKGQPLGLFPSFASFALTHGLLLQGLLGKVWDKEFFILGDDVVILDESLYVKYRAALASLDCPISDSKSLSSSSVAEFRSVIYLPDRKIPQFKWRELSDDSFLDIVRNMPFLYPLLRKQQRVVVDLIKGIPEEYGGLGWNSEGRTRNERMRPFDSILLRDEYVPRDRLTGYTGYITKLLYNSNLAYEASVQYLSERKDIIRALDQRAIVLVRENLHPRLTPLYEILGRNLDLVFEGDLDLPTPGFRISRVTTLMRWMSTLRELGLIS